MKSAEWLLEGNTPPPLPDVGFADAIHALVVLEGCTSLETPSVAEAHGTVKRPVGSGVKVTFPDPGASGHRGTDGLAVVVSVTGTTEYELSVPVPMTIVPMPQLEKTVCIWVAVPLVRVTVVT